ncbi:hypothetical protein RN053_21070 [Pantoea dispersa]|nr:hypothetical protein [Pantoea dispersa]MDT8853003.1 hypothetical protein [Pantoea dispersa]
MTDYLKSKWQKLRIMKMRGMAEINYRIIRLELKLRGGKHASTRA